MTVHVITDDTVISADDSQISALADDDTVIVTRDATLVSTGVNSPVVRAASFGTMVLNGELIANRDAIVASAGLHIIDIGTTGSVTSAIGEAINLDAGGNYIVNAGRIAAGFDGIDITGDTNEIVNTGQIAGDSNGIELFGAANRIANFGTITGSNGPAIAIAGDSARISNQGTIAGLLSGGVLVTGGGASIVNAGTISAQGAHAVEVAGTAGWTSRLVNTGTIWTDGVAGNAYLGGDATDVVVNHGLMIGNVILGAGADRFTTRSGHLDGAVSGEAGADDLTGGDGDDVFSGGADADVLRGFAGDDFLEGGEGVDTIVGADDDDDLDGGEGGDTLRGGAGEDYLDGGEGGDRLSGGAGDDRFLFTSAPVSGAADVISDFAIGADLIGVENAVFTGMTAGVLRAGYFRVGAAAVDSNDHIIYDDLTGALLYDSDGRGAVAAVKFAQLDSGLALTNTDFYVI